MRRFVSLGVLVLLACGVIVGAVQDPARTLVGRWEGQRHSEDRVDNVAVVFRQTDKGLTGEVLNNGQVFNTMTNIVATADTVTFDLGDLQFKGAIDVKSMTMTLTAHFQDRDLWSMTVTKKKD